MYERRTKGSRHVVVNGCTTYDKNLKIKGEEIRYTYDKNFHKIIIYNFLLCLAKLILIKMLATTVLEFFLKRT